MTRNEELRKLIEKYAELVLLKFKATLDKEYTPEWRYAVARDVERDLPKVKARIEELLKGC